jgi:hypothetical protein
MRIVEANLCAPNSEERQKVLGHDFIVSYERFFYLLSLAFDLKLINFIMNYMDISLQSI